MPFLRRRGVLASESDIRAKGNKTSPRRHANSLNPDPIVGKQSLPKSLPDSSQPSDSASRTTAANPNSGAAENGDHDKVSMESMLQLPPATPTRESEDVFASPESPPIQDETPKHRRFSMLRFRNASDSQLSTRMKQQQLAEKPPPMPQPPAIITTAPTMDTGASVNKKQSRMKMPLRIRRSMDIPRPTPVDQSSQPKFTLNSKEKRKSLYPRASTSTSTSRHNVTFEESTRPDSSSSPQINTLVEENSALVPPANRISDSSRSESSCADQNVPPHPLTSSNSFFRLGRRRPKQPEPLFPMGHLPQKSKTPALSNPPTLPRNSTSTSHETRPSTGHERPSLRVSPSHGPGAAGKTSGSPATALFRPNSRNSAQSSPTRAALGRKGRSSTMSSLGESFIDPQGTSRTSSSFGRKSFGDLLGLSRVRPNADQGRQGSLTPATPGSVGSKNNSLQLVRESIALPPRREDDTPARYLARLEEVANRGVIASVLSKETDAFFAAVLRSYMRSFSFFEEPMDMAIRKLLMEAELPKETQQIDRCLQAFANRYHECNPGIYSTPDQAYFIAFSLLILHTDVFNKNNKYKMQKADYLKNTRGEGIFDDVLECFYDNISYTPFIHVEDEFHGYGERGSLKSKRKTIFPNSSPEPMRKSKDPIDPYTLILDGKLDLLRPPLKDQMPLEEHYSYLGTGNRLNLKELQKTFFKTGVLQIVSARSRPDAFMSEKTQNNPQDAHPGIVDIKVTKVGLLWRKDVTKRKKTRSPWQEWGAILTGAQLYFFRNTAWVKNLMHQYETHIRSGNDGIPLVFNPPLEHFKPDTLMSTEGAVALWDSTYKKHKNAFVYVKHGGLEEVLLAQSEEERNDWLAKLNYAAAFKTSGVRMRGLVGGNYEGQSRRVIRRLDSTDATHLVQTPTGEVTINRGKIDQEMARDILVARREFMQQKIEEAEEKLQAAQKHLDTQLRNARHVLLLAPIQEKTRESVRGGAARIIAQLKWSRTELWRLKCHRDILALDLAEERDLNGEFKGEAGRPGTSASRPQNLTHKDSRGSSNMTPHQSPLSVAPLAVAASSESAQQSDEDSPVTENFQTPPTSAKDTTFRDIPPLLFEPHDVRKPSVSSTTSSDRPVATSTSTQPASSPHPAVGSDPVDQQAEQDAREMRVLEQAGLLDVAPARSFEHRPSSSGNVAEEAPRHTRRTSSHGADKDKHDRNKIRRSLQRTLKDGAGHLSHHRSRRGKDSASSGGLSDETIRDEILYRGTGSFTLHGKKASVINFGEELREMATHKRGQAGDEATPSSPASAFDDFQSVLGEPSEKAERRGSGTSASTATARSFRELHRKYSYSRTPSKMVAGANLSVPADEDSDAAISFSEGRRSPLPPLDDEEEAETSATDHPPQARFYTPEPASPPVQQGVGKEVDDGMTQEVERLPSPVFQEVRA
ncbi:hypothetical protein GGR56DRAFT_657296 [Xylariaceae sp. FL0804]|nr:hypothetical protein GGR56DRAFT_657296 [Xylariaceae sp. FL0804]